MYTVSDLRKGLTIAIDNEPYTVISFEFTKPGKGPVSYTHLRAHETVLELVCRLLLDKKKKLFHVKIPQSITD